MPNPNGNPNWKKGESANPNGRPKGSVSIVAAIKKKLEEEHPTSTPEQKKLWLDMIVEKIFDAGIKGEASILKDMIDRVDGKAKETLDLNAKIDNTDISDENLNKLISVYESRRKENPSAGDNE